MTLTEFAELLDASPKWVLNTLHALQVRPPYSVRLAQQLTIARVIHDSVRMPLTDAFAAARLLLRDHAALQAGPIAVRGAPDSSVVLMVDVQRLLSSFNVRLATTRESFAPRLRGRPRSRVTDALEEATEWGLDLSLIRNNLQMTPAQRLRQLDGMRAFAGTVRRATGAR